MIPLTLVWGSSFAAMKMLLQMGLGVGAMLALRATVGAVILAGFLWFLKIPIQRQALKDGCWLGLVLIGTLWLQADGLRFTTTSKSGFITGLYVLFTPVVSLWWGDRLRLSHVLGAIVATLGLYLLVHEPGMHLGGWNRGDSETLLCAIVCGFQIVLTAHYSRRSHGLVLALVQVAALALVSWVLAYALPSEPLANGARLGGLDGMVAILLKPSAWVAIVFLGALSTALAFYLMSTLQAYLGATEAAIIYSLEPVFASLVAMSGWVVGVHDRLSPVQLMGGAVILLAMLMAELGPKWLHSARLEPEDAIG